MKDITTVVVSNDDKGLITFRLNVPSLPKYTVDVDVDIFVDTDNNAATGSTDIPGVDYVIQLFRGEINLYKWDGTDFTRRFGDPPATTLIYQLVERREHQHQRDGARQHEAAEVLRRRDRGHRLRPGDGRARLRARRRPTSRRTSAGASSRTT